MYYRIDRVTGSREVIAWRGPIRIRNDKRACGCRSAFAMAATAATPMEPAGLAGEPASNVYIVDTGNNPFCKLAPGGAINTVTAAPLRAHLPRVRHFRRSLYRRGHCLPPLPHDARWDHHA